MKTKTIQQTDQGDTNVNICRMCNVPESMRSVRKSSEIKKRRILRIRPQLIIFSIYLVFRGFNFRADFLATIRREIWGCTVVKKCLFLSLAPKVVVWREKVVHPFSHNTELFHLVSTSFLYAILLLSRKHVIAKAQY